MSIAFTSPGDIRSAFSGAMSAMYRVEVPLYAELIDIVHTINAVVLGSDPALASESRIPRLAAERHGAIRIGTAEELSMLRRAFAVMGMHPVGYYDLAVAGVPVHSTAFRPLDLDALNRCPFRVFTSLLRLELIEDADLRKRAERILAGRRIFTDATIGLIERCEAEGGLGREDAGRFVAELLMTFRWQSDAVVDARTYERLAAAHRLVADVVSFKGPHINHLTPRVLDIDAAQVEMARRGIDAKAVIEGPPRRSVPILLRQTSFKALKEKVRFLGRDDAVLGVHTARFGEIEQRGIALTPKGRAAYDALLDEARGDEGSQDADYLERLAVAFAKFPDTENEVRRQGLAYFRYSLAANADVRNASAVFNLEALIADGTVATEPVIYEDFLPISAAGIFQSNLGGEEQRRYAAESEQAAFEAALGSPVHDPFALYEAAQRASLEALFRDLRLPTAVDVIR